MHSVIAICYAGLEQCCTSRFCFREMCWPHGNKCTVRISTGQGLALRFPSPHRGIPTMDEPPERHGEEAHSTSLDLLLEGSHWVRFHNGLCWLCLHFRFLTKHHADTCLCGWLHAGLDAAKTYFWVCPTNRSAS